MRMYGAGPLLGLALLITSGWVNAEPQVVAGQRCFGAAGEDCTVRNGTVQEGYCIGTKCPISGGSWEHDECCWKRTVKKDSGKSCIAPAPGMSAGSGPAQVCNAEWVKALQRTSGGWNWWRSVDTSLLNNTGKVVFNSYCAETGSRVHVKDVKYCCSKRAVLPTSSDVSEARICR